MSKQPARYTDEFDLVTVKISMLVPRTVTRDVQQTVKADDGLAKLSQRMDTGDIIGTVMVSHVRDVPHQDVSRQLRELGNDGRFYDHLRTTD
jgi:hypothetical protein